MYLYKYLTPEGIDIIQKLRILVQDPNNFNDPFEFTSGVDNLAKEELVDAFNGQYGEEFYKRHKEKFNSFEEFKKKVLSSETALVKFCDSLPKGAHDHFVEFRKDFGKNHMGLICFSAADIDPEEEILLWSHYASSHKGIRILFDVKKIKLHSLSLCKVNYSKQRLLLHPLNYTAEDRIFSDCLTTKSQIWEYEKEFRWLISYEECFLEYDSVGNKKYYIGIGEDAIVGVDLGLGISNELRNAIKSLLKIPRFNHVVLRQAEMDLKNYALNYKDMAGQ